MNTNDHKQVTRTVCRVGYGFAQVTVKVAPDADEAAIEQAILDVAGNHSFSEKDAEYTIEGAGKPASAGPDTAKVLARLLDRLASAGFCADDPINGGDAVDAVSQAYDEAIESLSGSELEPYVIYAPSEDGCWNDEDGWGASPAHYFGRPAQLPTSAGNDAVLMRLNQWQAMQEAADTGR